MTATFGWVHDDMVSITFANGTSQPETIKTTPEHPFHVAGLGFIAAGKSTSRRLPHAWWRTYNLTIAADHTYFVGKLNAWVHNAGSDCFGWTPASNPNQLWSKGKKGVHFSDHGVEVGATSANDYTAKALDFAQNPPESAVSIVTEIGRYLYDPVSKLIFVGARSSGKIKTFYKWDGRTGDVVIRTLIGAGRPGRNARQ